MLRKNVVDCWKHGTEIRAEKACKKICLYKSIEFGIPLK